VSTASHNWSKVLMGERSHPPCEGWQGNVAGGNGFSQSAETWGSGGGSLGAAAPSVYPDSASDSCQSGDVETLIVFVCLVFPLAPAASLQRVFDYYFGPFLPTTDRR